MYLDEKLDMVGDRHGLGTTMQRYSLNRSLITLEQTLRSSRILT